MKQQQMTSVRNKIPNGVVHTVPTDLKKLFATNLQVLTAWQNITPLARNEWLCWIMSAKKSETRERRIRIMCENLVTGKRRPCCWAGCIHR